MHKWEISTFLLTLLFHAPFPPALSVTPMSVGPPYGEAQEVELTHVQLPDETGHVVVFEILGQHLFGKASLVEHMEAGAILQRRQGQSRCQRSIPDYKSGTGGGGSLESYSRASHALRTVTLKLKAVTTSFSDACAPFSSGTISSLQLQF